MKYGLCVHHSVLFTNASIPRLSLGLLAYVSGNKTAYHPEKSWYCYIITFENQINPGGAQLVYSLY